MSDSQMKITKEEFNSPLWRKIKHLYAERLHKLRVDNDRDQSDIQTAKIRGKIEELKYLAQLDTDRPAPPISEMPRDE